MDNAGNKAITMLSEEVQEIKTQFSFMKMLTKAITEFWSGNNSTADLALISPVQGHLTGVLTGEHGPSHRASRNTGKKMQKGF